MKEIGFERERYPSFQKRDAHALRFGSMNPITRLLVHGVLNGEGSVECGGKDRAVRPGSRVQEIGFERA